MNQYYTQQPRYYTQQRQPYPPELAPQPAQPMGTVRVVPSRAEAETAIVPFDGLTHFILVASDPDTVYSKTFNGQTGATPLVTYTRVPEKVIQYATLDDLAALRDELRRPTTAKRRQDDAE